MAIKIPELEIDGVVGEVYDKDAVHQSELADFLSQENIRLLIGNLFFPVGSIYITASDTNPAAIFGGTWESVQGRVIMGADGNHPVDSVGGSEDSVIPQHRHYISLKTEFGGVHTHSISGTAASAGRHRHDMGDHFSNGSGNDIAYTKVSSRVSMHRYTTYDGAHTHTVVGTAASSGTHQHDVAGYSNAVGVSGVGKNNMPYVAYYIWRRTA